MELTRRKKELRAVLILNIPAATSWDGSPREGGLCCLPRLGCWNREPASRSWKLILLFYLQGNKDDEDGKSFGITFWEKNDLSHVFRVNMVVEGNYLIRELRDTSLRGKDPCACRSWPKLKWNSDRLNRMDSIFHYTNPNKTKLSHTCGSLTLSLMLRR